MLLNSCISEKAPAPVDCSVNPVVIESFATTMATCGLEDGTVLVNASGGSGDYEFSLNNSGFQLSPLFGNLIAGNYQLTVKDANGCTVSSDVVVDNSSGMFVEADVIAASGCDDELGIIDVVASGGEIPYQFRIDESAFQSNNKFENLASGTYTLVAKDINGCEATSQVDVPAGTSLDLHALPIFQTNCAVTGCHNGNNNLPNFSDKSTVIKYASQIKLRTGNKTMPPGDRSITDEEIQTIACWVDDGANNN